QSTTVIFVRPAGSDGTGDTSGTGGTTTTSPPDTGSTTTEPPLGTGDVQVTLRWSGTSDLDLHVTDPAGAEINFSTPTSPRGGQPHPARRAGDPWAHRPRAHRVGRVRDRLPRLPTRLQTPGGGQGHHRRGRRSRPAALRAGVRSPRCALRAPRHRDRARRRLHH